MNAESHESRTAPRPQTHPRPPILESVPTYAGLVITTDSIIRM